MNSRARDCARFAIAAGVLAVVSSIPCFAQGPAQDVPAQDVPAPDVPVHGAPIAGYLNPDYLGSANCTGQAASTPGQNSPAPPAQPESSTPATAAGQQDQEPPGGKRVFGVLPNYRTASSCEEGTAISPGHKIQIALKDSFDYPLVLLSAAYAGLGQLTNDEPSFGQGIKGYAHRLVTNYADQAVGNMMTEGFLPVLFRQDPRYFRRGPKYGIWYRTAYAASRVIVTDSDSGHTQFNYSEWLGNGAAAALSNIWEPDDRNASANVVKLLEYVGTDAVSQVLKEFWPDLKHKFFHRGDPQQNCDH